MEKNGFAHRLRVTPEKPGVYMLKNSRGDVLYVGKAINLRNRLRSYFVTPFGLTAKIQRMVARLADFEFIVTDSEAEALILECTLIKKFRPRYNARLKDDKSYPYLKIDLTEDFPQVYITRRVQNDGARYFGPFSSAGSIRKTMDLLKKLFPYRSCTKVITGTDPRPCLEYYIHRCVAPCIGAVGKEEYHKVVQQVIMFLEGESESVVRDIKAKMQEAAERLEFERAALLRDQLRAIQKVMEDQQKKVASNTDLEMDVVAMTTSKEEAWVETFFIRRGKLVGRDNFIMEGIDEDNPGHVIAEFVKQFYQSAPYVPARVLVQHQVEEKTLIQQWLRSKRQRPVRLSTPRGELQRKLMRMVQENAVQGLNQRRVKWLTNKDALQEAMAELQEELSLPHLPRRIECYDISNIQGTNPVASMVVFQDGTSKTAHYRRFRIKTVEGVDDYAMMQEVTRRRFRRLAEAKGKAHSGAGEEGTPPQPQGNTDGKEETWGIVPDLVLIDGGKGHLSSVLQVFLELGIDFIPLASIAKENEWLFVPQTPEPIVLPRTSQALYLIQRVRDEAHRFAITYHRQRRSKAGIKSAIDVIPGIGPKRKRFLLRRFGSLKGIREASVDELASVPGMTRRLAQKVKESL